MTGSAPEAWLVFPKDRPPPVAGDVGAGGPSSLRSFTARPVNFAGDNQIYFITDTFLIKSYDSLYD